MTTDFEKNLIVLLRNVLDTEEGAEFGPRAGVHPYMHDGCVIVGDEADEYMLITTSDDDDSPGGNLEFYVGHYSTAGNEERQFITSCVITELPLVCRAMWEGTFG